MDWLSFFNTSTGIISSIVTIIAGFTSFAYFIYRKVITPIKKLHALIREGVIKVETANKNINDEILPFINSFKYEFSANSGKSLKDQITRIDQATRLAELRSKLIATNLLSTGAFECDAMGNNIWVNKALAELFGLEREEMLGNGWLAGVVDDEREDVWEKWSYALKHNIPFETEYTVHNKETRVDHRVRATAMAHKTVDGKILGFFGTVIKL